VKTDTTHDVDRWRKDAESDGRVSTALRGELLVRSGAQLNATAARFFRCFANLAEDVPADALACMALLMSTAAPGENTERTLAVVDAALARYDTKPKGER
jgi:hypothetical protein